MTDVEKIEERAKSLGFKRIEDLLCDIIESTDFDGLETIEDIMTELTTYLTPYLEGWIDREGVINKIKQHVTEPGTMSLEESGYDSWHQFLSDAAMQTEGKEYTDILFDEFKEDELEKLWKDSHVS